MREYHLSAEGVPEYINMLEDAQRTAIRINQNNLITDSSVLADATASMLSSQQFPRATEEWEHLKPSAKTWTEWKDLYKKTLGMERVRVKSGGGADSFRGANPGGANAARNMVPGVPGSRPAAANTATDSPPTDDKNEAPFTAGELEAWFDNLANAAKAERATVDELVKSIAALTATNSQLVVEVTKLGKEKTVIQQEVNGLWRRGSPSDTMQTSGTRGGRRNCRH